MPGPGPRACSPEEMAGLLPAARTVIRQGHERTGGRTRSQEEAPDAARPAPDRRRDALQSHEEGPAGRLCLDFGFQRWHPKPAQAASNATNRCHAALSVPPARNRAATMNAGGGRCQCGGEPWLSTFRARLLVRCAHPACAEAREQTSDAGISVRAASVWKQPQTDGTRNGRKPRARLQTDATRQCHPRPRAARAAHVFPCY